MESKIILALVAGIIGLTASATPAQASTTVYNVVPGTSNGSANNLNFIGQAFTTSGDSNQKIETLDLYLSRYGLTETENFRLALFNAKFSASLNAYRPSATPGGVTLRYGELDTTNALYSKSYSNADLGSIRYTSHTVFDVSTYNWNVEPNTVYMIGLLALEAPSPSAKWTLNTDTGTHPGNGFVSGYSGMNGLVYSPFDQLPTALTAFDAVITTTTTTAVPEASTSLGLLALSACGLLTRRRTNRKA
jgi:hypothetical protein